MVNTTSPDPYLCVAKGVASRLGPSYPDPTSIEVATFLLAIIMMGEQTFVCTYPFLSHSSLIYRMLTRQELTLGVANIF